MIYLLKGDDYRAKEAKIDELKKAILTHPDAVRFDFDGLDAAKLAPDELKKTLLALPAVNPKRLIFIRNIQKASDPNQEILLTFIKSKPDHCVIVADCGESSRKGFLTQIAKLGKVIELSGGKKASVFDMTKYIEARNPKASLTLLAELLGEGNHPLQIMGGLVWIWGRLKNRISAGNFQQGLRELQAADLNIKRSRLPPEHAVEILVTKLCLLAV